VFFVQQDTHPQLVSALPPILEEVRALVGPARRVTVVFDRGGWSPDLFTRMNETGFDVLTYRKGKTAPLPADAFRTYIVQKGRDTVTYELAEQDVDVGGLPMRQVTRRTGDHQTHIVTTRRDWDIVEVAQRMFDRWRQENFFKYMREHYAIDALVEYGSLLGDPKRLVGNPARRKLDNQHRAAKRVLERLLAELGAARLEHQDDIDDGPVRDAQAICNRLDSERRAAPAKVAIETLGGDARLPQKRKRFTDMLKMLAYHTEATLARMVAPFYRRSLDEGMTLIRAAFQSSGAIEPLDNELRITLAPQSSPHRTAVVAQLCELLTETETRFPGTNLKMVFAIQPHHAQPLT
jgi:hypothetical protein